MDLNLPPLHLFDQGEIVETNDEFGYALRSDVMEWCKKTIGPVYIGSMHFDGGSFELKNSTSDSITLRIQIKVIRFETDADLIAFKLRWR